MNKTSCAFLIALLVALPASAAPTGELIGHIHKIEGSASIMRDGATVPGVLGGDLYRGDVVRTGKPGAVGLVLTDDTTVSLGSGSELSLNNYEFAPKEGHFGLLLQMVKGTFSYVSGQIAKLAPESARIQTPDATIAIRGTKLLIEIKE